SCRRTPAAATTSRRSRAGSGSGKTTGPTAPVRVESGAEPRQLEHRRRRMGFEQYHEPAAELNAEARTFARMIASLTEEAEAIGCAVHRREEEQRHRQRQQPPWIRAEGGEQARQAERHRDSRGDAPVVADHEVPPEPAESGHVAHLSPPPASARGAAGGRRES